MKYRRIRNEVQNNRTDNQIIGEGTSRRMDGQLATAAVTRRR
jgi:hypothetical protein